MPSDTDRLGLDPSAAECARLVRASDPDRYFATLFAPAAARPSLFALYAFAGELAGIRRRVSEPMPGEIRLQWWRDALDDVFAGRTHGAPVADALARAAVAHDLPRPPFDAMIDARVFDLYDDIMPTLGDLEGYCGETEAALVQLATITLAPDAAAQSADAAGHAGVAIGLARILSEVRAEPWRSAFLPRDIREEHLSGIGAAIESEIEKHAAEMAAKGKDAGWHIKDGDATPYLDEDVLKRK